MGSIAASGGLLVACSADKIVANPGTITGSISAIMQFANIEELLNKIGLKASTVKSGKYKDIADLVVRVNSKDLNKKSLESLGKSGALDSVGKKEEILANIEKILKFAKEVKELKERGQASLFGGGFADDGNNGGYVLQFTEKIEITKKDRLGWEKELLGLYISENPLSEYEAYLSGETTSIARLNQEYAEKAESGEEAPVATTQGNGYGRNGNGRNKGPTVTIGGIITKTKKIYTRNNKEMLFAELEDLSGKLEVVVFPNVYARLAEVWKEDAIIWVKGTVNDKDGTLKLLCDEAGEVREQMKEYKKAGGAPSSGSSAGKEDQKPDVPADPSRVMTIEYTGQNGQASEIKGLMKRLIAGRDRIILSVTDTGGQPTKIKIAGSYQLNGDRFDELANYLKTNDMQFLIDQSHD